MGKTNFRKGLDKELAENHKLQEASMWQIVKELWRRADNSSRLWEVLTGLFIAWFILKWIGLL